MTLLSPRTRLGLAPIALVLALAASAPAVAFADPSAQERAAAQALFDDARKLMADKKFAEACPKLEESQRIDPGLGTLLNLAECQTQLGKTASAWANFLDVAYQAKAAGQSKREVTARDRATKLEAKLSKLTILAVTAGIVMEIKRDGVVVAPSLVGTSVPVDPGEHTVSVSAPGKKTWQASVIVKPDGHLVTISVPRLEDEAAKPPPPPEVKPPPPPEVKPPPPPEVKPPPPPQHEDKPPPEPPDPPGGGLRAGGVLLGILGLGGLGAAATFTVLAKQKDDASKGTDPTLCDEMDVCGMKGKDFRNQAIGWGRAATIAVSAGGVSLAAGVSLVIAGVVAKSRASTAVPAVTVTFEPGRGGTMVLTGRF